MFGLNLCSAWKAQIEIHFMDSFSLNKSQQRINVRVEAQQLIYRKIESLLFIRRRFPLTKSVLTCGAG